MTTPIIKKKIRTVFGKETYVNNQLDTQFLAKIVFNDSQKLELLNKIVHPEVTKHFQNFIKTHHDKKQEEAKYL